jgi:hypothetical protein
VGASAKRWVGGAVSVLVLGTTFLAGAEGFSSRGADSASLSLIDVGTQSTPLFADATFLSKALGSPVTSPSQAARDIASADVSIEEDGGYKFTREDESVFLAADDAGSAKWLWYTNGASRRTPFGAETVVIAPDAAEQFLTVERRQGPRTWSWTLRTVGLVPQLADDGRIEFFTAAGLGSLALLAPRIVDAEGGDVSPDGLRWSLEQRWSAWRLSLSFDDSLLPLPYVIDPATVRSVSSAGNMGATTLVILKPVGVVQGDFLIASVTVRDNPTITAPLGWNLVRKDPLLATTITQAIFSKVAGASEPASYTWTFSSVQKASGGIIAYVGVDETVPIEGSSGASGSGMVMTAPGVVTTTNDATVVAFFGVARSTGITAPVGMTERYQAQSGGGAAGDKTTSKSADVVQATAGPTGSKTATAAQGADWVAQLVALRPKPPQRSTLTTLACPRGRSRR